MDLNLTSHQPISGHTTVSPDYIWSYSQIIGEELRQALSGFTQTKCHNWLHSGEDRVLSGDGLVLNDEDPVLGGDGAAAGLGLVMIKQGTGAVGPDRILGLMCRAG